MLFLLGVYAVGVIAGFLNVMAGGGSLITLPMLIFLGLPAATANGTNRVAILMQGTLPKLTNLLRWAIRG